MNVMTYGSARFNTTRLFLATVTLLLLFWSWASYGQTCKTKVQVANNTSVYDRTPVFSTSQGWNYGSIVAKLNKGTTVFICQQKEIRFGFQSQQWTQISYYTNSGWRYGWVQKADLVMSIQPLEELGTQKDWSFASFFINIAHADQTNDATDVPTAIAPPEDAVPPNAPTNMTKTESAKSYSDGSALINFYIMLFIVMLIGMAAKTIFDYVRAGDNANIKNQLRQMVLPLLISPIVFLGFMQTADLTLIGMKSFIVINLMSFQNGFFWQTVFGEKNAA